MTVTNLACRRALYRRRSAGEFDTTVSDGQERAARSRVHRRKLASYKHPETSGVRVNEEEIPR